MEGSFVNSSKSSQPGPKPLAFLWSAIVLSVLTGILAQPARADDGYYSGATNEYVYGSHVTVQMVRERVQMYVKMDRLNAKHGWDTSNMTCVCDFVFKNHGPATTVTMAFPEFGSTSNEEGTDSPSDRRMLLLAFRSFVNGKDVLVKAVWNSKNYAYDHVKQVKFGKNQTLRIRDVFHESVSEQVDRDLLYFAPYLLGTGGTWKNHLERAEIDLIELGTTTNLKLQTFPKYFSKKYTADAGGDRWAIQTSYLGDHNFGPKNSVWVDWPGAKVAVYGNIVKCVKTHFKPVKDELCRFMIAADHYSP